MIRPSATRATIRGLVVDEHDRPVPGPRSWPGRSPPSRPGRPPGRTDTSRYGSTARRRAAPRSWPGPPMAIAWASSGMGYDRPEGAADAPVRIILKPARRIAVRVAHAKQGPVPDVPVEAAGTAEIYDRAATNPEGLATLRIPADARVEWIYAVKPGLGCDYAEFGSSRPEAGVAVRPPASSPNRSA